MFLLLVGCSFRSTPVALRERLAFSEEALARALTNLEARFGCEAVIVSTCNRVEIYLGRAANPIPFDVGLVAEFLEECHGVPAAELVPHLYERRQEKVVHHLFQVVASLDSMVVGEVQIAGQVKRAYELARARETAGPLLHALFQQARTVAGRARKETGISSGHASVSSVAVDYVRQVFERFSDKTVLVIGAGKMGELTLRHLADLKPQRILVTNRSFDKAESVARGCGGQPVRWEQLDEVIGQADVVLSTTGAPQAIMTRERYRKAMIGRKKESPVVILDVAVPRDFDPEIHDGDRTLLFNIDDLNRIREQTLQQRRKHVAAAEAIVEQELRRFLVDWERRRHGPVIARLTQDWDAKRQVVVRQLLGRLNGKLTEADRAYVEGAFRLLQNQFLHGPITALTEEPHEAGGHTLLEALRKLFRLHD